jgi:protoheme IX farnesyltransferase
MFKQYYALTKPGIIYGNIMTTLAAFLFATRWHFNIVLLLSTMLGMALVIASACVVNNYIDRDIDKKMKRTSTRALAIEVISGRNALTYATVLGILGFAVLIWLVNLLTAGIALVGFMFYVVLYTYAKRYSIFSTLIGSVCGACPIVVGYTGATGRFDLATLILFLILVCWQMPHFYAIGIRRLNEYTAAGLPILPVVKGIRVAKLHSIFYMVTYIVAASALTFFGYAGYIYLATVLLFGIMWLMTGLQGLTATDDNAWAKKSFLFSLVVLLSFSIVLSVGSTLP